MKLLNIVLGQKLKHEEVTTGEKDFQLKCEADFSAREVVSFNWIFNGSFIHPSLNRDLSILNNGDLNFELTLPSHAGILVLLESIK